MTWINFLSYLGMGYAAYYLLVILLDSRPAPGKNSETSPVLTFSETVDAQKVGLEDLGKAASSGIIASGPASVALGGVSIKELFHLARQDAIQLTRTVSF